MLKVKRALISVSDKTGIIKFAQGLQSLGVEILSTGGTASKLRESGIKVIDVSDYTGFPEMMDGRVKTLHPKVHAGILAVRDNPEHMAKLKELNIGLIDMVVVNLYPFESVIQKKKVSLDEAIENIDIGGPAMLRSAAKNFKHVAVICNPLRYQSTLDELNKNNGLLSDSVLFNLSVEAFQHTARYDGIISSFLSKRLGGDEFSSLPKEIQLKFAKVQDLRYGENPHQKASFYRDFESKKGLADLKQLNGKELSYNNILDLNAAIDCVKDFENPVAVVIKHNNPTGICEDKNLASAFKKALACDPISAFGGIIGFNKQVDLPTAQAIFKSGFMECVIAPSFDKDALEVLKGKKNLRVVEVDFSSLSDKDFDFKRVHGGMLLQEKDALLITQKELKPVTKSKPTKKQIEDILFGWKVIKNIKSNAIVLVKDKKAVGIGCGNTSRVESVNVAIRKAGKLAKDSILVSEAFIPKMDNVQLAVKAKVKVIVQTGGSIADEEVIKAADKAKLVMVFTGVRHFKH